MAEEGKVQPILGIEFSYDDPGTALVDFTQILYRLRKPGETGPPENWLEDDGELCEAPQTPYVCLDQNMAKDEVYDCRARHITHGGVGSAWSTIIAVTVGDDLSPPANPTNFSVTPILAGLLTKWNYPSESDYWRTEIQYRLATSTTWNASQAVFATGSEKALSFLFPAPYQLRVRHWDTSRNRSG